MKEIKRLTQKGGKGGFRSPPDELPSPTAKKESPSPEKEKNSIASLFDGIPSDLRSKVQGNPVRGDRVNDWLQKNVDGKEKAVEFDAVLRNVYASRAKDGTYVVTLEFINPKVQALGGTWELFTRLTDTDIAYDFRFHTSAADAEKLADISRAPKPGNKITIQAKVERALVKATDSPHSILLKLHDARIDEKAFTPFGIEKAK